MSESLGRQDSSCFLVEVSRGDARPKKSAKPFSDPSFADYPHLELASTLPVGRVNDVLSGFCFSASGGSQGEAAKK